MSEHHKFRYLLPPGNNFQFVAKFKAWLTMSVVLMAVCISILFVNKSLRGEYMNWTIDFKGGTEVILAFKDKATGKFTKVDPGVIRKTLEETGERGFDVSEISWSADDKQGGEVTVDGMIVRTPRFSAFGPEVADKALEVFHAAFKDRDIGKATWSGDRLSVRSRKAITSAEAAAVLAKVDAAKGQPLEVKPWSPEDAAQYGHPDEGTGEYNQWYPVSGIGRQFEQAFEKVLPNVDVTEENSYMVSAKAGDRLRDDAVKSVIYAIFLIMLYLAFRFDIRYAPGAAFATIHDAVMVIGVFAVTWTEVSLVSVAGLLTVMGFSVNDTVIVFDRIRENQAKLKDKKIERIIDISLNEVLVRTILTSSTVFATTLIMNIFGTGLVKNFAFAMNIGVIVGTYSSIFLAVPIFMFMSKKWYSGSPSARRRAPIASAAPAPAPDPSPED